MMKNMVLATNFGKANEMNLCEKEMGFLVKDKDYQTISDRLSEMEPMEASRWLAMQDEHLRFSVACLMAPEKAKKICECENQVAETGYLKTGVFSLAKSRIFWLMALMISGMITGTILARYESAFAGSSNAGYLYSDATIPAEIRIPRAAQWSSVQCNG